MRATSDLYYTLAIKHHENLTVERKVRGVAVGQTQKHDLVVYGRPLPKKVVIVHGFPYWGIFEVDIGGAFIMR